MATASLSNSSLFPRLPYEELLSLRMQSPLVYVQYCIKYVFPHHCILSPL